MSNINLIKNSTPLCIWQSKLFLGEGVTWSSNLNSILFVDIKKKKILIFNNRTKRKKVIKVDKEIGFIFHIKKNIFIMGLKSEIRIVDLKKKNILNSIKIETEKPNNRINDGKIDPSGRLWFGTMDNFEIKKTGSLYCLDNNLNLHKVDQNYFITNGPSFINKNNFYHTDSRKRVIYKIKINKRLKIIKKKIFIKFNKEDGSPDGMTTDIKNNLWVCHYRGSRISVYNKKGRKIHNIYLPAKNITNCTFGGFKNNELYITTALKGMKVNDMNEFPQSGSLFKIKTNIKGKKIINFITKKRID